MKKLLIPAVAVVLGLGIATQAADTELSVTAPRSVSVTQGKNQTFTVSISRKGFTDPVKLTFNVSGTKGVKVVETDTTVPKDKTRATFTLQADADAPVTSKGEGTVAAEGGGRKTEPARFLIKVVER